MKKVAFCVMVVAGLMIGTAQAVESKNTQASCGQMLAAHADIPAKMSEAATAAADMWEAHAALMGKDKDSTAEAKGLRALAKTYRTIAANLKKASEEMQKAASWPTVPHDKEKMAADPKLEETSKKALQTQKEAVAALQKLVAETEAMHKPAK